MSEFPFSFDNKRYHTLYFHNQKEYGSRVYKATLDASLSCPNIENGSGGCIFCQKTPPPEKSVKEQFLAEKERIFKKDPNAKINAYFGIHTNTFCSPEYLQKMLNEAKTLGAFSVSVATRADCLDEEKIKILSDFPLTLTVELGLQSVFDETAKIINRGYPYETFLKAYELLRSKNIRVCVHIINGLPNETEEMMLKTAEILGKLRPNAVKIHLCHVLKNTRLCEMYQNGEYSPLSFDEYVNIVVKQLRLFPPETVIERITGDGNKNLLKAPLWSRDKISVLGAVDKRLSELDAFQGDLFKE